MTQTKWIKLILISYLVSSALGCQGIPKPEGKVGIIHVKDVPQAYINEFDLQKDFDDDGHVISGHTGTHRNLTSMAELDKYVAMSAKSYANSLAFYKKLKARYEQCIQENNK